MRFVDLTLPFEDAIEDPQRKVHRLGGYALVLRKPSRNFAPRLVVVFGAIEIPMHCAISGERELRRRVVVVAARAALFFDDVEIAKARSSGFHARVQALEVDFRVVGSNHMILRRVLGRPIVIPAGLERQRNFI